ncbi:dihydropteroate synthase [Candidatus Magnetaquicoccus inordinatus]|uniref:dihydropteroate synthase n=1 Tax=Candidatus Magnetaquicoccus inordinatus TaxID=2496818 RepID=UPI00102BE04D|nr:dihydropteroate synthase [Candidatus Magnetaquicoccus inordinatus]
MSDEKEQAERQRATAFATAQSHAADLCTSSEQPLLQCGRYSLDLRQPHLMGIINVTPDSFSGDGLAGFQQQAVAQGLRMVAEGADLLDVGGESTRPGAQEVSLQEELDRVIPVIAALVSQVDRPIAVDTRKAEVMQAALQAGATMINDVNGLQGVSEQFAQRVLAPRHEPIVLMHMQGDPATMQQAPCYQDVLAEVIDFLSARIRWCEKQGIARQRLIVDPGIGFGKKQEHNMLLLCHLRALKVLELPILLGVSRKSVIGWLSGEQEPQKRDVGSHVLAAWAVLSGVSIIRVHDVQGARQALAVANGLRHACHGLQVG